MEKGIVVKGGRRAMCWRPKTVWHDSVDIYKKYIYLAVLFRTRVVLETYSLVSLVWTLIRLLLTFCLKSK